MDTASSHNARPATGFRRQANRAVLQALRILPSPLRRRLGWWRWEEVIGVEYTEAMGVEMVFDRPPSPAIDPSFTPLQDLWRRGLVPESGEARERFFKFHPGWDTNDWASLSIPELKTWAKVFDRTREGKNFLGEVLVDLMGRRRVDPEKVRHLLIAGARPGVGVIDAIFTSQYRPMEEALVLWGAVCASPHPTPSWEEWASRYRGWEVLMRTHEEMETWRQSGLPMPTGKAALVHALAWLKDQHVEEDSSGHRPALDALRWFKQHGKLPDRAPTIVLMTWLLHARPSGDPGNHALSMEWMRELCEGGLPPHPRQGPASILPQDQSPLYEEDPLPWSHWLAHSPQPHKLPSQWWDLLFSEPDAWTAKNRWGEDAQSILQKRLDRWEEERGEGPCPHMQAMRAWMRQQAMDKALPSASRPDPSSPAPSFPPRNRL